MVIILFGVAGAGKTVIGLKLAAELGWKFYDADDFHSPANIEKMSKGIPLTDEDRRPWLERLAELIKTCVGRGENVVLACSALKDSYRQRLKSGDDVKLVYLKGDYALIKERLKKRRGHFINPELLRSQFETLEEPQGEALVVDVAPSPGEIVQAIRSGLSV
ncbi:MAG TPA: gluconokinase [Pyrinomonadaceae bacterium]